MAVFSWPLFWTGYVRTGLFWGIALAAFSVVAVLSSSLDINLIVTTLSKAFVGNKEAISTPDFAFSLAVSLGAFAFALALAYLLTHVLLVWGSLRSARKQLESCTDSKIFASSYDGIRQEFDDHPLIGHAWREFDETLVFDDQEGRYCNTVRPQSFINIGALRERLIGLKLMGSIPGYFVGIGLLLTFIGLVLALSEASSAVGSNNASAMQDATRRLLEVATFKFATSIAGLGASIALSFLFKLYSIWIERALHKFCAAAEDKLHYLVPQSITAEMNKTLAGQLTQLKEINSEKFFAEMGKEVAPQLQAAFHTAMAPMTDKIDQAMDRLSSESQSGVADLVSSFSQSIQGSAGTELQALAGTLGELQQTLKETQRGIQGSGEAFGQHMAEAASGKSAEIEAAMGQIFGQLGGQIEALQRGLGGFQDGMINHLETTRESVAAAQDDAVKAVGQASTEAADALRTGLGDALVMINREVTRFSTSLGAAEEALTAQGQALRDTTRKSGEVAMAFGQTARAVQAASTPLIQSGERIAGAAEQMTAAVARSVETLQAGQMSLKELADRLAQHNETLAGSWENYQERFEGVDESLGQAVAELAKSAQEQGQRLNERVVEIDRSFAEAIDKLNPALGSLSESAESLSEDVEKLVGGFEKNAAD